MRLREIIEARSHPDQNRRVNAIDFLRQYKDNPRAYLHTTSVPKVGIYPKSTDGHDSPVGIYAYRLADIWEDSIERWNSGEYKRGLEFLPYNGGPHLFILESDIDPDFPRNYSEEDLARDIEKMKSLFRLSDGRIENLKKAAQTNLNFRDIPAGYLWGMTKALVAGIEEFDEYTPVNTKLWNSVLRRMGYVGFNDPGFGFIHGAESTQALFLTSSAFKIVDHFLANRKQKTITIGDKDYTGGRLPKDLHMNGIPNTLFYNYKPRDFVGIRSWTVDGMALQDLQDFIRFVPWNAQGIIKRIVMGGAANESYERSSVFHYFQKHPTLPKNIHVEDVFVGGRMPIMLIEIIPETFPFASITIHEFAMRHGLEALPDYLKSKIKIQPFR